MTTSSNPVVQASEATMTAGGFPPAGTVYEFINTDKNNALYFIDSNGNFSPVNDMGADCCACRISEKYMDSISCALNSGLISALSYEQLVGAGFTVTATETPNAGGGNICTVSMGILNIPPSTLVMTSKITTLSILGTHQLGVTLTPVNAYPGLLWVSSNNSFATVDQTGFVKGISAGTATITVYSIANPLKTDSTTIVVS